MIGAAKKRGVYCPINGWVSVVGRRHEAVDQDRSRSTGHKTDGCNDPLSRPLADDRRLPGRLVPPTDD